MGSHRKRHSGFALPPPEGGPGDLPPFAVPLFLLGLNAEVIQLLLFRETLMLSNGSEVSLGLALAAWALFNGLGALAGSLSMRRGPPGWKGRLFTLLLLLLPLFAALSIHAARVIRTISGVPGTAPLRLLLFGGLASMVLAPVTFLDGFLFVAALDAFLNGRAREGASDLYGTESLGSVVGGLAFTFLLVHILDPYSTAGLLLCGDALFLVPPTAARFLPPSLFRGVVRLSFFAAGAVLFLWGGAVNARSEAARWRVLQPALELVEVRETPYQHLAVLRYREEYSLFGNGHLLFALRSSRSAASGDWNRAVFPNFAMLQREGTGARVVLVGGGSRGWLPDLLEHRPERIDWVEVDRGLVELAYRYMVPEERAAFQDPRVFFHPTDGRAYLRRCRPASVDLIVLDVPDPVDANLNRYYTIEFFRECRRTLRPKGVLVLHMTCQPNFIGETIRRRNGSVYAALRRVFPRVTVTPGTLSFMAAGGEGVALTADPETLLERYRARNIASARFSPYLFYTWLVPEEVAWINHRVFEPGLKQGAFTPNRDVRPVAYLCEARHLTDLAGVPGEGGALPGLEGFFSGTGTGWTARLARSVSLLFPVLGMCLFLLARIRRRRTAAGGTISAPGRFLLLLSAGTAGFCGIVLEVVVLMIYQNLSGHLYSRLGLVIAAYMAGLSAGALLRPGRGSPARLFAAAAACMAAGCAGAMILSTPPAEILPEPWGLLPAFFIVTLVLGAAGGLVFRAVTQALGRRNGEGTGGGLVYTFDILGTCLGGWQAGGILIPAFGIRATLILAGLVFLGLVALCFLESVKVPFRSPAGETL